MAISHDEAAKKLVELEAKVTALVNDYNNAYQSGKYADAVALNKTIEEKVNEYTSVARDDCFEACKNSDNPMLTAVSMLSFVVIGVKDVEKGDEKLPVREVIRKERNIDLFKLHKYCGGDGIGADTKWLYMIEQLNLLLTVKRAEALGIDPKEVNNSYAMSNISKEISLGKNPVSNTSMLKTLQSIITAMIGADYKVTSHDVNFLNDAYAKKSRKALTITVANHKTLRSLMAEICHRVVTAKGYNLDYKKVKQQ